MRIDCFLLALLLMVQVCPTVQAKLYLNELLASNQAGIRDEDGKASDWIELFNQSDQPHPLGGYTLSDDPSKPSKWTLPDVEIPAMGFVMIWTSDKDRKTPALHTNFGLKQEGEPLILTDPQGKTVDRVDFGPQIEDQSLARIPDGGEWKGAQSPTPGTSNQTLERNPAPRFSVKGGFYDRSISLEISPAANEGTVFYTVDCSTPTLASKRYEAPIDIEQTTVIRARAYLSDSSPSAVVTQTYFLEPEGNLPSLSLVVAPMDLHDASSGMLENIRERGPEWERQASLEFFEKGKQAFAYSCGVRIHGGISRSFEKNSFRVYFSSSYGPNRLNDPILEDYPVRSFKRLVLSAGSNDTVADTREIHSAVWSLIRDALMNELFRESGIQSIGQRPVRLYLNGKPWGIYWLKERIDKYFVEDHFGYKDFDLLKHEHMVEEKEGNLEKWDELNRFLMTHPLHLESNYRWVEQRIDLDNFISNHLLEMWSGNVDWPHNNHYQLRPRIDGGRWQWIPWDNDVVLGSPYVVFPDYNMYDHVSGQHRLHVDWSTLHFRSLLSNQEFRERLVRRAQELLETVLSPENVERKIVQIAGQLRPDIAFETDRWGSTPEIWEKNVDQLIRFARLRDTAFREHTQEFKDQSRDPAKLGSVGVLMALATESESPISPSNLFEFVLRQRR